MSKPIANNTITGLCEELRRTPWPRRTIRIGDRVIVPDGRDGVVVNIEGQTAYVEMGTPGWATSWVEDFPVVGLEFWS